jgi:hypothetical protein
MRGKFFISREIFESDIWEKPSYYLKVWIWIIGKANWKTIKKGEKTFNRGEFKTEYKEIIELNRWRTGWRTEKLTDDQIFSVLDFLRKTQRIQTHKTTRGLWIKVLNYDYFQRFLDNESNTEPPTKATAEQQTTNREKRNTNEIQMKEPSKEIDKSQAYKLKIIFLYASKKKVGLEDANKKQSFIKRNLRPAENLVPYPFNKVEEVMDWLAKNADYKWTLETVGKYIDENLSNIKISTQSEDPVVPAYAKEWIKK